MVSICLYFHVHQPTRLNKYNIFDIGKSSNYFNKTQDEFYINRISEKCYIPTNRILLDLINNMEGKFKLSFSLSGIFLDQLEEFAPDILQSFKDLVKTGCVELISDTYYHSLAFVYSKEEFKEQVLMHKKKIKKLFNQDTQVFRNTELIYNNELAKFVEKLGFKGILAEGVDHILGWRSPNFVYRPKTTNKIRLLLKNYKLSDDIAYRFSNKCWEEWPLTVGKYSQWINKINGNGEVVNLFMDYETFGEHQWPDTGIFEFLKLLPSEILKHPDNNFKTVSEAIKYEPKAEIDVHNFTSWADMERDLSAWLGNKMQQAAANELYQLERQVKAGKNQSLIDAWRKLQISDHFYHMCTKSLADGDVHRYFSNFESPYDTFINFMNILNDLALRSRKKEKIIV